MTSRTVYTLPFTTTSPQLTAQIIGGGVVGLAIARHLALTHPVASTLLLERHSTVGTETSSRNSEVIHAGLYYPPSSLKTSLCIRGASLLYDYCRTHHVPHKRCGKWIVAQRPEELQALEGVYEHAVKHGVPMRWLTPEEVKAREPNVRAAAGALESPNTGIVDSHALMQSLLGGLVDAGGDVAVNAEVTGVVAEGGDGYTLTVATTTGDHAETRITAATVINAAGLGAISVANLLHPERRRKAYFCKGTYYVPVAAPPKVSTLIYPAPVAGRAGLGTHLTMDMAGAFRFGPDVEWVDSPDDVAATDGGMVRAREAIATYLPGVGELRPDYAGIRPKLHPHGVGGVASADFWIKEEDGYRGWVNLLGIESPGRLIPRWGRVVLTRGRVDEFPGDCGVCRWGFVWEGAFIDRMIPLRPSLLFLLHLVERCMAVGNLLD